MFRGKKIKFLFQRVINIAPYDIQSSHGTGVIAVARKSIGWRCRAVVIKRYPSKLN